MGCDIHSRFEVRQASSPDCDPCWHDVGEGFDDRDYEFFAAFADVRNYHGITPIAKPRDLPDDACENIKELSENYGIDGHSHSWFTLAEIKAFDTEQEIDDISLVLDRNSKGEITSTCMGTSGSHQGPVGRRKIFSIFNKKEYWNNLIERMEKLRPSNGADDDVRMVFFFDN